MKSTRQTLKLTAGLALAVMLGACGGGGPAGPESLPPTPPPPTPRPPFTLDRGEGSLPALVALFRSVVTTETGALDVFVDWTFAANDIDVFLARGTCSFEQFRNDQCSFAASATSASSKPERLRLDNQPAGTYTVIVANFGPGDESISYHVMLAPGASAASASAARGASASRMDKVGRLLRGIVR